MKGRRHERRGWISRSSWADPDRRFSWRSRRDSVEQGRTLESVITPYLGTVRPLHLEFVESGKRYADLIIPEGRFNAGNYSAW